MHYLPSYHLLPSLFMNSLISIFILHSSLHFAHILSPLRSSIHSSLHFAHILSLNLTWFDSTLTNLLSFFSRTIDPWNHLPSFVQALNEAATTSIPKTKPRVGRKNVPYWNNKCQEAVEKRNVALNKMRRSKELCDCIEYRVQKGITQKIIKDAKRTCWRDYCGSVNDKTKMGDIWRTTRKMSGVKQQSTIPNLKKNETTYETNAQKAQLFVETFAMASSDGNYSDEFKTRRSNFIPDKIQENIQSENEQEINKAFELHELRSAINKCKRKSSPGLDSISYEIIKEIPRSGLLKFLEIINLIWSRGDLPGNWKHAIINPILKPTKPNDDPCSYRPISLTSTCCKVMERMISERLVWYLETKGLNKKKSIGIPKESIMCRSNHAPTGWYK